MRSKHFLLPWAIVTLFILLYSSQSILAGPDSFAPIVKSEREKVVHISISAIVEHPPTPRDPIFKDPYFDRFFKNIPRKRRQSALGSGFIISSDGYIVTNHHVIEKADKIEVTLFDGTKYKAIIVGKDKLSELALIKIESKNLPYIKWGDSKAIEVGDWVLAIGNPLGLDHTVTAGIISGRGRSVFGATAYGQFLQTDAAINFGNSGGPLYNMDGEVIGINTAIVAGGQNLGFAIPSNLAQKVVRQLRSHGKVQRGFLGVWHQDVSFELAESFGLPQGTRGVVLTDIEDGSPADKAGLKQGDVIVEFEGKPLSKASQLQQYVGETAPGEEIKIKIFRKGDFLTKQVKLGLRPSEETVSSNETEDKYGLKLVELTPEIQSAMNLKEDFGLFVANIDQSGIAAEKGMQRGDLILEANNRKLETVADFSKVLQEAVKSSRPVNLLVVRQGRTMFIALPVK